MTHALIAMTSGWTGFAIYWLPFICVAMLEAVRPSGRPANAQAGRMTVNFGLGLMVAAIQLIPFLSLYAVAISAKAEGFGLLNIVDAPAWVVFPASFLLLDLLGYLFHRASHRWRLLWRLHQVHHSDRAVDASTTFRAHPLSMCLLFATEAAVAGLFGVEPHAVLFYSLCKLATIWLSHADIAPSPRLSRTVSWLIVTPAFHRHHHSAHQPETDSNYGEVLTIWDRLFGSVSGKNGAVERLGLGDAHDRGADNLAQQILLPFRPLPNRDQPHNAVSSS